LRQPEAYFFQSHQLYLQNGFAIPAFPQPAGAEVTFTATNYGLAPHNFIIFKKGFDAGEKFDHEDDANVYWRLDAAPGQTVRETFTAPTEPGEYHVVCGVHSHLEDGMVGKLTVK
jgi:plastocyanin